MCKFDLRFVNVLVTVLREGVKKGSETLKRETFQASLNSVLSIVALNQEHSLTYTACISLMQQ